ncbi:sensor histidine kinase [Myxacorys almedinensis]|uniref:histidine kinase n=1 Tax=Myxacorys almedinensis A TaxID=2690445 RepID=A0A8J8CMS7_9CYAN|nr:HAMP domain-containing sensor histidine kinase [Myxacorys almedinensis]NDJ17672.1 sensor histidine kinase [Myxacorys almedinensis A]
MFQTTRRRLALWYTTITAILLLVFASGFYFYVRSTLIERIDDTLDHVIEVVERSLVIQPDGTHLRVNVEESFRDNAIALEDDHIDLEWISPTGETLWSTFAEPLFVPLHVNSTGETVHVSATQLLRQVTRRVEIGRQVLGYLRVSHPWFEVTKPVRQLVVDLSIGTTVMIAIVAAIGWFLSGLAMQPIRESYQRLKQFTADASHELRNPIAIIQTNVQVALADPHPEPQSQRHHLQVVERLTRRLGKLVDDLLFLARQDSGIVQPYWTLADLSDLLAEVLEEQETAADEKAIALSLTFDDDEDLMMQCDRDQLSRLFTNLISNAVQYTPKHGNVSLALTRLKRSNGSALQVKVTDTGIGISEETLPKLFDRFYRVDPARTKATGGSGLGLAIAQAIVENHHGQIQIESKVKQGTTLTVTLPQTPQDPPER